MTNTDCPFCSIVDPLLSNDLAVVVRDKFAVSPGHVLILPVRHVSDYFVTTKLERAAIEKLLFQARAMLERQYSPDGYNIGINVGREAGQTITHVHVHLIPRYRGDLEDPRGGIRGVIPNKRIY